MPDKTLQPAVDRHELGYTLKSVRVGTGAVPANGQADVTVAWPTPFADTNYACACAVEEGTADADTLSVLKVVSRTAAGCTVRVANADAADARAGTLHVVGAPD